MDGIETLKRLDAIKSELEGVRMNSSKAIDSSSTDTKKMVDTIENIRDSLSVILTWQFKELQKTLDFLKKDSLDERKDKEIEKQKDKKELDKFKLTSDTGIKSNNPLTILSSMMGNMKSMMTLTAWSI